MHKFEQRHDVVDIIEYWRGGQQHDARGFSAAFEQRFEQLRRRVACKMRFIDNDDFVKAADLRLARVVLHAQTQPIFRDEVISFLIIFGDPIFGHVLLKICHQRLGSHYQRPRLGPKLPKHGLNCMDGRDGLTRTRAMGNNDTMMRCQKVRWFFFDALE